MTETSKDKILQHVAIIMDGNGRWAENRGFPRFKGHLEGVKRVEEIVELAARVGIKVLTLYTFSTENWNRPENEVSMLMKTICAVVERKTPTLVETNIRLQHIGRREGIPGDVLKSLDRAAAATCKNTGLILNLAFNYGSRQEILGAVREVVRQVQDGRVRPDQIDEQVFGNALYTHGLPDPDLLIRTSGEKRISNFLLWQISYAEVYFAEEYWPDFGAEQFMKAVADFRKRERRFGNV